jgi:DNA-binding CsgD family transcriptional regulator
VVSGSKLGELLSRRLWLNEKTLQAHVRSILNKLDFRASDNCHRRVLAVLAYLREGQA